MAYKGEIIIRNYECGCRILSLKNYLSIDYCPKHKAAPELYEACKLLSDHMTMPKGELGRPYLADAFRMADKAIFKAEGSE